MMTAEECRAKADALVQAAEDGVRYASAAELQAMAQQWRRLARLADWQEFVQSTL